MPVADSAPPRLAPPPTLSTPEDIERATETLAHALQATAVERDRAGGHAAAERELIRASGLLNITTPRAYGGGGQPWARFYRSLRRIAQADSALAHLYAFHHLQVATIVLYGKEEVIRFGEFVIHCLHTPGHSAGSISPYLEINGARVLFAQDISAPPLLEFSCDPLAWRRSLDKLIALEADILCDGHTGVYRPKSRVKAYFQRILRTAESR